MNDKDRQTILNTIAEQEYRRDKLYEIAARNRRSASKRNELSFNGPIAEQELVGVEQMLRALRAVAGVQ